MIRSLFQAARPLAHANIAPPILFGQALALAVTGRFSWTALAIAQGFGVLDHLYIVFANDWADRHDDASNTTFNAFSGGSRVLPEGRLSPRTILGLAIASGVSLLAVSFAESAVLGVLAAIAVVLMLAYSYPPLRLSYRGGGEWLQGLGVGVLLPLVGFLAQCSDVVRIPWAALVPTFVLGVAGNVLTALPDEPADRAAGKRTWVVRRGDRRARRELVALVALGIVLGAFLVPIPSATARTLATAIPLGALGMALPLSGGHREPLLRFMLAIGAASTGAIVAWCIALVV